MCRQGQGPQEKPLFLGSMTDWELDLRGALQFSLGWW